MPEADPTLSADDIRTLVRDGYDAIAERYTENAARDSESHPRRSELARLLGLLRPGSEVLELGCGGGVPVAAAIVAAGHSYTGVDLSPRQIEIARSRVPLGDFVVADAAEHERSTASADAVVMLYAITHVRREGWPDLFARVRRWLRRDGWLLISFANHGSPGWLEEDFLGLGGTSWTNAHDPNTSLNMLEVAGFDIVDARTLGESDVDPDGWLFVLARASSDTPRAGGT